MILLFQHPIFSPVTGLLCNPTNHNSGRSIKEYVSFASPKPIWSAQWQMGSVMRCSCSWLLNSLWSQKCGLLMPTLSPLFLSNHQTATSMSTGENRSLEFLSSSWFPWRFKLQESFIKFPWVKDQVWFLTIRPMDLSYVHTDLIN